MLSFALAVLAALSLAWFMYFLTHASQLRLDASAKVQMLDFVRLKRQEVVQRKDRKPERPQVTEAPQAPPSMDAAAADAGASLAVSAPTPMATGVDVTRSGLGIGTGDGEYLPIVKVAPIYPRRALERGIPVRMDLGASNIEPEQLRVVLEAGANVELDLLCEGLGGHGFTAPGSRRDRSRRARRAPAGPSRAGSRG